MTKGLVGGIQRFSTSDGPGIRTTVFLKGCPLQCAWCHNPELISPRAGVIFNPDKCIGCHICVSLCPNGAIRCAESERTPTLDWGRCAGCQTCGENCVAEAISPVGRWMTVEEVMEEAVRDRGFYEKSGGGVTLSGGELLMQSAFAEELTAACCAEGITVTLDTSGQGDGGVLLRMAEQASDILYDMKMIEPQKHKELTGLTNELILNNLVMLARSERIRPKILMRMPLIGGVNDTEDVIEATCRFYCENGLERVSLLPYHELGVSKLRHLGGEPTLFRPPTHERIEEIRALFEAHGIRTEVLGEEISRR